MYRPECWGAFSGLFTLRFHETLKLFTWIFQARVYMVDFSKGIVIMVIHPRRWIRIATFVIIYLV